MYGIKGNFSLILVVNKYVTPLLGKIDATLEAKGTNSIWNANKVPGITSRTNAPTANYPTITVPLELKTGSDFDGKAHKAQVNQLLSIIFLMLIF